MAYIPKLVDRKIVQDQKMKKLKKELERREKQMAEYALLRQKLEELVSSRLARKQKTFPKANNSHVTLTEKIDRICGPGLNFNSKTHNKALEEIRARTKEFQKSQAEKATLNRYLVQERERILEAHKQLREKRDVIRSLPSPVDEATERVWGHKYSIYTPLHYDDYTHVYTPAFQDGYYTYFPRPKRKKRWFNSSLLFVPTPLFQSLW